MARIYVVPHSQFQPGHIGRASRLEEDKEWLQRRRQRLLDELARLPAEEAELDRQIEASSLERWRVG